MKKLLLGALLLLSMSVFAQDTFVKKYNSLIVKEDDVAKPLERTDVTVVFNPDGIRDIVIYYSSTRKKIVLHQISSATEGKTEDGDGYQIVECINDKGVRLAAQLFDDNTCFRILFSKGNLVEFHNDL
jgi:hypothetical protein